MIGLIARKDFLLNITSARFILGFLICLFLIPFTLIVSMDRHKGQQDIYKHNAEVAEETFNNFFVYSMVRPEVVRQPESLSIFSEGINENLGTSVKIQFGEYPLFMTGQTNTTDNPLLNAFFSIDFSTIIAIIMSLLALVFSYDCFTREHENGTMRMVLVNKISRTSFFLGKLCGILLTLLPILIFCYLLSILFISISPNIMFSANEWLSILLLFFSSVLYVIVFVLLGMFISSIVKQSSTSIVISLLAWIWFLFLMPNIASYAAQSFVKTDLYDNVDYSLNEINKELNKKYDEKGIEIKKAIGISGLSYWNQRGNRDGGIQFYGGLKTSFKFHKEMTPWQMAYIIDYADKKWAVQKAYYDGLMKQEKVQRNLALLSPSEIFIQLSSSLCHTDAHAHTIYMDKVREYREQVIRHFKENKFFESSKWFTPTDFEYLVDDEEFSRFINAYFEASDISKEAGVEFKKNYTPKGWNKEEFLPLDLSNFPAFQYKAQIKGNILNFALYRFALLLFIAIILLMATMLRFRKYQV